MLPQQQKRSDAGTIAASFQSAESALPDIGPGTVVAEAAVPLEQGGVGLDKVPNVVALIRHFLLFFSVLFLCPSPDRRASCFCALGLRVSRLEMAEWAALVFLCVSVLDGREPESLACEQQSDGLFFSTSSPDTGGGEDENRPSALA